MIRVGEEERRQEKERKEERRKPGGERKIPYIDECND